MVRIATFLVSLTAALASAASSFAQSETSASVTYEVMINGESFLVEGNRLAKLKSRQKPGVAYDVAVRIAPTQRLKLSTFQFEYDRLFKVEDDRGRRQRTARLVHELGFTMLISDLGAPLKPAQRKEALQLLVNSVTGTLRKSKMKDLSAAKPHKQQFANSSGQGVTVRYRDTQDFAHTCLVYVLHGKKFTATCIAQFLDNDREDVLPMVKKTLDSIGPLK